MQKCLKRLYYLYKTERAISLEFSVQECLKHKAGDFLFSELHTTLVTQGPDTQVDTLKSSLISKYLESSTSVYFSTVVILQVLRQLFVNKISQQCALHQADPNEDRQIKRFLQILAENLRTRALKITNGLDVLTRGFLE
jgi:hypothetical protein